MGVGAPCSKPRVPPMCDCALERDEFTSNHHPALPLCLSMIFFRKTDSHPASSAGQAFSGSCCNTRYFHLGGGRLRSCQIPTKNECCGALLRGIICFPPPYLAEPRAAVQPPCRHIL